MSEPSRFELLLMSALGEELAEKIQFRKVEMSSDRLQWTLFFCCKEVLNQSQRGEVERAIGGIVPKAVSFTVVFEEQADSNVNLNRVAEAAAEGNPALGMLLKRCQLTYCGDTVQVKAPFPVEALLSFDTQECIREAMESLYQIPCQVTLSGEDMPPEPPKIEPVPKAPPKKKEVKVEEAPKLPKEKRKNVTVLFGRKISDKFPITDMIDLQVSEENQIVRGKILKWEKKEIPKIEKNLYTICMTDYTSSVTVKVFVKAEEDELADCLKSQKAAIVRGKCRYDDFAKANCLMASDINGYEEEKKTDDAPEKRVELHLHTNLSALDSVVKVKELVGYASQLGHDTLAVTDHGVVQAFPDMYNACKKAGIKCIYGMEAYLTHRERIVSGDTDTRAFKDIPFVVFDIETTGLNAVRDRLTEIGAVKVVSGVVAETFSTFVNPEIPIPAKITELTGITDTMVKDAPSSREAVEAFNRFADGAVLVAHNAAFDSGFMRQTARREGLPFTYTVLDTLSMARRCFPEMGSHKLNILAKKLGVSLVGHHRAMNDAEATAQIFLKLLSLLEQEGVENLSQLNEASGQRQGGNNYHALILVKDAVGLKNLYSMVTDSHIKYYHRRPRIPKDLLIQRREGLILGSACEQGELYRAMLDGADEKRIEEIAQFYDFLEIQPTGNNMFMVREGQLQDVSDIQQLNMRIVTLGEKLNKPVVATGDVHFLHERDEYFRRILQHGNGYSDSDNQAPLYYRTTQEMLDEFDYLSPDKAYEIVVTNPRAIAEKCQMLPPFPMDRLYTPEMEGAEDEIRNLCYKTAHEMYGECLPEIISQRIEKEINAINGNGFAVLYLIAHKVVKKSLSDGYLVGSRGSVGSSFVATMTNITEVNPLPPHYRCPECKFSDFDVDTDKYGCGFDLPDRNCPRCGHQLKKDGFDIPFEVFMGFKGNKAPDIDLNFSGKYQPVVHKYIEELFGEKNVFRAGTLSTLADKTAYGYVKKYAEEKGLMLPAAELDRLTLGVADVKRSTGQHPGGMVVLPKAYDIHLFTPLQYPANDERKGKITTHFAFSHLHDTMLKLDILGHDDPTMIRMLEDLTGISAKSVPLDDQKIMSLFNSPEALGVTSEQIMSKTGTYGIPEFGTNFVRGMLLETKPQNFSDLVRISGLSHGTDVWSNNAQDLVKSGQAVLSEVICTREDIMNSLIYKGMPPVAAFTIMESVRKGKGLTPEMEENLSKVELPPWFVGSLWKIKYMFPKAHAAAYVTMAYRIAFYKLYHPHAYYTAYFTVRADDFDAKLVAGGAESIKANIDQLNHKGEKLNPREKGIVSMLELALEMNMRGIEFAPLSLMDSLLEDFSITPDKKILPPLKAMANLSTAAAQSIIDARADGEFTSRENLIKRTKITKSVVDILSDYGVLDGLSATEQLSFF